eukprot:symbB.v1.2.016666.t3/scaffold1250.1/size128898/8
MLNSVNSVPLRTPAVAGRLPVSLQSCDQAALEAALYTNKVGGLPPGWEEYVSEEHGGRIFFVFSQTGDTTWERPTLLPDGTVQFFPTEDSSPTGSKLPPAPDLRGKGKLGSLRKAAMTLQPDGEAAMPMAARRSEGMHGACPGSDEEPENEWMPMEREREVPASRRLPLQREALHGAPEAEPAKAVTQEDDGEDEVRAAVMASLEAAKNSQEVTLPAGWEMQTTPDGGEFYVNLRSNLTQWQVPKLPAHWEERFSRKGEVKAVATVGIIVATYALYVENRLKDPFYQPGCSASWTGGDCATVFKSSYGHILSHWGIVPKGSLLDLSLPILGLVLYGSYLCAISISRPFPFREELFLSAAIGGGGFSIYLLYVIKVILQEFCIVCFSFHCCNFALLVLAILEYRNPEVKKVID